MNRSTLTLLLCVAGCTVETTQPPAPEAPASEAAVAISKVEAEAKAIEDLLSEVEALTMKAANELEPEAREALLNEADAKVAEIERRRVALEKSLSEAEGALKIE